MSSPPSLESLEEQIARLEAELAELLARLPAHSIQPSMLAQIDELEEQLQAARARLPDQAANN